MSLFDQILTRMGDHPTVTNLAEKLGIDADQAARAIAALGSAHQEDGDTIDLAAGKTGMSPEILRRIREAIGGEGSLSRFAAMVKEDGRPMTEISGMAKKFFGK